MGFNSGFKGLNKKKQAFPFTTSKFPLKMNFALQIHKISADVRDTVPSQRCIITLRNPLFSRRDSWNCY